MKSISKLITTLLNDSLRVTYPFPDRAKVFKNDINPDYDFYTDISQKLFVKYKDKMLKLWGPTNTPPTPQSFSEEILINLEKKHEFLHNISHDFDGKILFQLDNKFIENCMKKLVEKDGELEEGVKDVNNMTQIAVLYPFGEIAQKLHLNQIRGINISECHARISEYLGYKIHRFSCLENSSHFHGIVLAYLLQKQIESGTNELSEKEVKFEKLKEFLYKKSLLNKEEIFYYGAKMLLELEKDENSSKLFEELNRISLQDMLRIFNNFLPNKQQLTIIDSLNLNKKMGKIIRELSAKGKVFYSDKIGYYVKTKNEKIVSLIDSYDLLTKEGIFLGFLYEISTLHL